MNHLRILIFNLFLITSLSLHAQNSDKDQSFIISYTPSLDENGLTNVNVKLRTRLTKAAGEMFLCYDADCTGNLEYQYKGKRYSNGEWSMAIRNIIPEDPVIQVEVILPNQSIKSYRLTLITGASSSVLGVNSTGIPNIRIGDVLEPGKYHVRSAKVIGMTSRNTSEIIKLIENKDKQNKITDLRNSASNALNSKEYQRAIELNNQILSIDYNDVEAKKNLEKIKSLIREDDLSNKYSDLMKKGQQAEQAKNLTQAAQFFDQAARIPLSTGNMGESEARRVRSIIERSEQKTHSQKSNTNSNSGLSVDNSPNVQNKLNKTTNNGNSISGISNQQNNNNQSFGIFQSPDGRYFEKSNNGVRQLDYDEVMQKKKEQADILKKEQEEILQKKKEEALSQIKEKMRIEELERQKTQENLKRQGELRLELIAAGRSVEESKRELIQNSNLSGKYENVEELMMEYNEKIQNMSSTLSTLSQQREQQVNAFTNAYSHSLSSDSRTAAYAESVGALASSIGQIISNNKIEKERKEALARLNRQKEEQLQFIKNEKIKMLTNTRSSLFQNFKEAIVPTSKVKIDSDSLFYFGYIKPSNIGEEAAQLTVTNIYVLYKYGDGTWPFKSKLNAAIFQNILSPQHVIHGYYTQKSEAEKRRNALLEIFKKTGGVVNEITLKSPNKPSTSSSSGDFWETGKVKKEEIKKDIKNDFWNQ